MRSDADATSGPHATGDDIERGDTDGRKPLTAEKKALYSQHRVSIIVLAFVAAVVLLGSFVTFPSVFNAALYLALAVAALFFMYTTMKVMIHMRD